MNPCDQCEEPAEHKNNRVPVIGGSVHNAASQV